MLILAGDVTLSEIVATQQASTWFVFPLTAAFILFFISALAETNRLPFDLCEAEAELVSGYHTEYSAMKFSMFFIAEYSHILTASALMATLFLGGWSIPFWDGDHMFWYEGALISGFSDTGEPIPASPSWWKTLLTFGAFAVKTAFFVLVFIWVRWTLPRFRYDQVMHLGWKVMLPTALIYVPLVAATVLILDDLGVEGLPYGLVLTGVSALATVVFVFLLDRDRIITGAAAPPAKPPAARRVPSGGVDREAGIVASPVVAARLEGD